MDESSKDRKPVQQPQPESHPLVRASAAGDLAEVERLLSVGKSDLRRRRLQDEGFITQEVKNEALRVASRPKVIEVLIEQGADEAMRPQQPQAQAAVSQKVSPAVSSRQPQPTSIVNDNSPAPKVVDQAVVPHDVAPSLVVAQPQSTPLPESSAEVIKIIGLYDQNKPDPFSFRFTNGLFKIASAYRELKNSDISAIAEAIVARPELADVFFKPRLFSFLPGRRDFRKELESDPAAIRILLRSRDKKILSQIDSQIDMEKNVNQAEINLAQQPQPELQEKPPTISIPPDERYLLLAQNPKNFKAEQFISAYENYSVAQLRQLSEDFLAYEKNELGGQHNENVAKNLDALIYQRSSAEHLTERKVLEEILSEPRRSDVEVPSDAELDELLGSEDESVRKNAQPPEPIRETKAAIDKTELKEMFMALAEDPKTFDEAVFSEIYFKYSQYAMGDVDKLSEAFIKLGTDEYQGHYNHNVLTNLNKVVNFVEFIKGRASPEESSTGVDTAESSATTSTENSPQLGKKIEVIDKWNDDEDEYESDEEELPARHIRVIDKFGDDEDDIEQEINAYAEEIPAIQQKTHHALVSAVSVNQMVEGGPTWEKYWKAFDEIQEKYQSLKVANPIHRFHQMTCRIADIRVEIADIAEVVKAAGVMEKGKEDDYKAKFMEAAKGKIELLPPPKAKSVADNAGVNKAPAVQEDKSVHHKMGK